MNLIDRLRKRSQIRRTEWEIEHYDVPDINLMEKLQMYVEIRRARRGLTHYQTINEAEDNMKLACSVLEKYKDEISPRYAANFEEQIRKAEIDFKNKIILGYMI
jgi:hypothetical protein